ncbi:LON peptidase substrate-binding domain-containing protein [Nocardioides caldifontis]|uniref:LON peptidase substrate-binding domain-containing protein n=1 Tax=Nocardioides caldifontis TaxID=2588938 RepID=UPI0011E01724|nr:LON peptidase substrate-binding domain-containing protein [Nocardioides caldifontis]
MPELLPLFPLNVVAFPGMSVPLHVFEERYRAMVRDLLALPDPATRLFGIIAIREGYEVGSHEAKSMYRTGCVVQLSSVEEYDDGRYDITAVGRHRMRVVGTDSSAPYLRGEVEHLLDDGTPSVDTARAAARALAAFGDYRALVSALRGDDVMSGALPRDPDVLSYALAATAALTLRERQQLLEAPTTAERLGLLRRMMLQEVRAMRAVPSLPATEVARTGWNPN